MSQPTVDEYAAALASPHEQIRKHPALGALLDPAIEPRILHRFLIEYCALGVQMTKPVESWIKRAGQHCKEVGLTQLGDNLIKHSVQEAGHDALFVDDAKKLTALFNERYGQALDAEALLSQAPTQFIRRYVELHEDTITSEAPFAQVAIELEIEGLSVSIGPSLLEQFKTVLGPEALECCSFLNEHVAVDVGHTALNKKMLQRLIAARPDALPVLVATGKRALETYLGFMGECIERAHSCASVADRGVSAASA